MAKTETIFVQAPPDDVNEVIADYEAFGWNVIGTQQISEDKGMDNYGYMHTSTFVKITFNRDANIPNKDELSKLQTRYDTLKEENVRKQKWLDNSSPFLDMHSTPFLVLSIIVAIIGFILSRDLGGNWVLFLSIPLPIAIIYKVLCKRKENKAYSERYDAEKQIENSAKEMMELVEEAKKLS